jgi:hypothetical protein
MERQEDCDAPVRIAANLRAIWTGRYRHTIMLSSSVRFVLRRSQCAACVATVGGIKKPTSNLSG